MRELFHIEFFRISNWSKEEEENYNCDDDNVRTTDDGHANTHMWSKKEQKKTTTAIATITRKNNI